MRPGPRNGGAHFASSAGSLLVTAQEFKFEQFKVGAGVSGYYSRIVITIAEGASRGRWTAALKDTLKVSLEEEGAAGKETDT